MNWDQLRELSSAGVTIGSLGRTYGHLATLEHPDEVSNDIGYAQKRFLQELGGVPELFAYPFGEHSSALQETVVRHGHAAAFGQPTTPVTTTILRRFHGTIDRSRQNSS